MKRTYSLEFENTFNGTIILDEDIKKKLVSKHKVYDEDLVNAVGDPYRVVLKPRQKASLPRHTLMSRGNLYEILCEAPGSKILFIVGRLFPDGNLYIITAYWANKNLERIYMLESEVLKND